MPFADPRADGPGPERGQTVRVLAGGDVRVRNQLDDERRLLDAWLAVDAESTPRRRGADRRSGGAVRARRGRPRRCCADSRACLGEPFRCQAARLDGRDECRQHGPGTALAHATTEAERVDTGCDRLHRSLLDADGGAQCAHLECVADDEAAEAELLAQEAGEELARDRRRRLAEAGDDDVGRHHGLHSRRDRGAKGRERRLHVAADDRERAMGVDRGVTVSREVLRAGGDPLPLRSLDERGDVPRHERGVGSEAADADHGVVWIRVHVGDGREVEVHAGARERRGDRGGHLPRQLDVVDHAEREGAGEGAAAGGLEPRHVPALLVDGDEQLRRVGSQGGVQLGYAVGIAHVVGEEGDAAETELEQATRPGRHPIAREADEEAARRQPLELAHCLTAPAVRPKAILRWTSTKKTTTGSAVSVAPAINVPQSTPRWVPVVNVASQIVTVCFSWLESRT